LKESSGGKESGDVVGKRVTGLGDLGEWARDPDRLLRTRLFQESRMSRLLAATLLLSSLSIAHAQKGVRIASHPTGGAVEISKIRTSAYPGVMLEARCRRGVIMIESSDFRTARIPLNHGTGQMPVLGFGTLISDAVVTKSATKDAGDGISTL
jgi:hypothetical protein